METAGQNEQMKKKNCQNTKPFFQDFQSSWCCFIPVSELVITSPVREERKVTEAHNWVDPRKCVLLVTTVSA